MKRLLLILLCLPMLSFAQSPQVGDNVQGGIVFYVDTTGGQISGLVAAPTNQPGNPNTGINWGCYGWTTPGADGTAIGTGAQNTIDIEAYCSSSGIAADICANLTLGGYSDWFLPSKDELNEMYLNIGQGNVLGLGNIGNFSGTNYWSSTEKDDYTAWSQNFSSGGQYDYLKYTSVFKVRAVRAFSYGCTDTIACNYDSTATVDDGSCILPDGCTDATACNYDPNATCDDGTCAGLLGCTDSFACTYDPLATCDDGSCSGNYGCTDPVACNYDATASCDDGSCHYLFGCMDSTACNYDSTAVCDDGLCNYLFGCTNPLACNYDNTALCDDGSCLTLYGCIDSTACNYDTNATCDDGSCDYSFGCMDATACNYDPTAICDDGSCGWIYGCIDPTACNYDPTATCDDGSCDIAGCMDSLACNYNSAAVCDDGSCILPDGCTDPTACNYDANAICDDGSCDTVYGCTDNTACNYDPLATCNDGTCTGLWGCMGTTACNYNPLATCDDGSCLTVYGCTDNTACNYDPNATCDDGSCIYMGATPTQVNCWDVFTFNTITCSWDTSGSQPTQPSLACWETATFNTTTCVWDVTGTQLLASISQSGDELFAVTNPIGLNANWYNIQTENDTTRVWLMEEDASSFSPTFECSYFIVVSNNGCIDTSETYYYGANAARIGSFVTSPNPTSGLINVKFDNPKNQFVMFELISNNGSKLDEFITIEDNLNIDLSKYPSGSYYLYFNSEDAVQGCRLEEVQKVSTKIILNK